MDCFISKTATEKSDPFIWFYLHEIISFYVFMLFLFLMYITTRCGGLCVMLKISSQILGEWRIILTTLHLEMLKIIPIHSLGWLYMLLYPFLCCVHCSHQPNIIPTRNLLTNNNCSPCPNVMINVVFYFVS